MKSDSPRLEIFFPEPQRYLLPSTNPSDAITKPLGRALSRAEVSSRLSRYFVEEVLAYFEITGESGESPSVAALFSQYDSGKTSVANLINVAPVYLRADPSRLLMFDAPVIELTEDESLELFHEVSKFFLEDGNKLSYGSAGRWYLECDDTVSFYNADPFELRGMPLEPSATDRRALGVFGKMMTEAQMILYESSVNQNRISMGKTPINSLWFWGAGSTPVRSENNEHIFFGKDDFSASCASFFGCDYSQNILELPERLEVGKGVTTIILPPYRDDSFIIEFLETVFPQILLALKRSSLFSITIASNRQKYLITSRTQRRFWRASKPLENLLGKTVSEF